jgi:hypothetical protein
MSKVSKVALGLTAGLSVLAMWTAPRVMLFAPISGWLRVPSATSSRRVSRLLQGSREFRWSSPMRSLKTPCG